MLMILLEGVGDLGESGKLNLLPSVSPILFLYVPVQ